MAKTQVAARFITEVAPPKFVPVARRSKVPKILDPIAEEKEVAENFSASFNSTASEKFIKELDKSFSLDGQGWYSSQRRRHCHTGCNVQH